MIKALEKLSNKEQALLLKAPVLLSVLVSCSSNEINPVQKADAIKLSHIKAFAAAPLLIPYYQEVEKNFEEEFERIQKKYAPFDDAKRIALKNEIDLATNVLSKLDKKYARMLYKSFEEYASHVKKSTHSVFQDFIFPLPIEGLSF